MSFMDVCILIIWGEFLVEKASNTCDKVLLSPTLIVILYSVQKILKRSLKQLCQEHLSQNQRVLGGNKKNFLFSITFVPEKKLLGTKLKKATDNYYGYVLGTTEIIESKLLPDLDLKDIDDDPTRIPVSTKIFKVFKWCVI